MAKLSVDRVLAWCKAEALIAVRSLFAPVRAAWGLIVHGSTDPSSWNRHRRSA
jgi:hypothetical protein